MWYLFGYIIWFKFVIWDFNLAAKAFKAIDSPFIGTLDDDDVWKKK